MYNKIYYKIVQELPICKHYLTFPEDAHSISLINKIYESIKIIIYIDYSHYNYIFFKAVYEKTILKDNELESQTLTAEERLLDNSILLLY